ncbi:amino-acid N-acetyltransferase [Halorhodospira abdelmalekii]|nr:amino-acid N-acetyltransferase [Halorhodospira abdelmalekii]
MLLSAHAPLRGADGTPVRELTPSEAQQWLAASSPSASSPSATKQQPSATPIPQQDPEASVDSSPAGTAPTATGCSCAPLTHAALTGTARRLLRGAAQACSTGVARVHLLDRRQDGALLLELFTRDGVGTMIAQQPFEALRTARLDDIPGILALIRPLEQSGALTQRSQTLLEQQIEHFTVAERDGAVVATAALIPWPDAGAGEIACLAVDPSYQGSGRAAALLRALEQQARRQGLHDLFALTTHAEHWFRERGFQTVDPAALPAARQALYDVNRGSKVVGKKI